MGTWSEHNIIIDTHRKRIRFLEYHAHPLPQQVDIHIPVDVFAIQAYLARDPASLYQIIHAV